jgi:hypothetical protein
MSYEPTIIIHQLDLKKAEQKILEHQYGKFRKKPRTDSAKAKQLAWDKLESILNDDPFIIRGVRMLMIYVEFTSNNKAFRQLLSNLEIEFAIVD